MAAAMKTKQSTGGPAAADGWLQQLAVKEAAVSAA